MPGNAVTTFARFAAPLMLGLALVGCDETGGFSLASLTAPRADANADAAPTRAQSVQLVERDVEVPEVFQVSEAGLWDGRPSLGGVWVAHPNVTEPERVIIRNQANGNFVIGALFRRERDNPGPRLQVSSDAANALGLLAGSPSELQVTALRREETATPDAAPVASFDGPADVEETTIASAPATVAPGSADPIASAAAAIDAAEAASATSPTTSALAKPFIQIGIFSVEANATRNAASLRASNIVPTVLEQESQGRRFWRVIVGPAQTEAERADLLQRVRGMGFADAYFVTN